MASLGNVLQIILGIPEMMKSILSSQTILSTMGRIHDIPYPDLLEDPKSRSPNSGL